MKLYASPGACSLSPHIVLRELGLPFELELVDLHAKRTRSGESLLALNPKGYVPVLVLDDGNVLTEGPAIVQYLADLKPEVGLVPPAGTLERYRLQEWLNFISTELHKGFGPLFDKEAPELTKEKAKAKLLERFAFVAQQLEGRSYLMGEHFSVADAYLFVVLRWTRIPRIDLAAWPALAAFLARVAERPTVKAALDAERRPKA